MSTEELPPVVVTEVTDLGDELREELGEELGQDTDFCAIIASAAQGMDNAGIFNVLSGFPAVSILCNEPLMPDMTFLVPDHQVQQAIDALAAALGYPRCIRPRCADLNEDRCPNEKASFNPVRFHAVGAAHFHIGPFGFPLTLYPMSKMAWWLRDLNDESPHLTLASACKPLPWAELYPVRVLTRRAFVESLILLRCRDYGRNPRLDSLWHLQLLFFIQSCVDLSDGFMPFWFAFSDEDNVHDLECLLCELRDKLTTGDGLPVHPDYCPGSWKLQSLGHWRQACTALLLLTSAAWLVRAVV